MKSRCLVDESEAASAPFFPEEAVIRRVHREAIVLAGAGRALLMQIAHPMVAAGVREHSSFRNGKRTRLLRTLKPTLAIVFGTRSQALAAAASINRSHSFVTGDGYRADDPELLFWVLATLIDTALFMHESFLRPLTAEDAEAYYQDMLTAGELLGVRRDLAPRDLDAFRSYMAESMPRLRVTAEAHEIARDLFSGPGFSAAGGWALRQVTKALLQPELRDAYGFRWPGSNEKLVELVTAVSRTVLPRVPLSLRGTPGFLRPRAG